MIRFRISRWECFPPLTRRHSLCMGLALLVMLSTLQFFACTAIAESIKEPSPFSYQYFEALPEGKRISEAKQYLDTRFPQGSNIQAVIDELTQAGAKCAKGNDRGEVYFECYYHTNDVSHGPANALVMIEWTVFITPDSSGEKVQTIKVARYLTGP